jgi:hypothetical protein
VSLQLEHPQHGLIFCLSELRSRELALLKVGARLQEFWRTKIATYLVGSIRR